MRKWMSKAIEYLKRLGNALPDKKDESEVVQSIEEGVSFRGATLWVLAFAILTASLGLNVNSTAVIIGAMLISPLMGPIIGMGLGIGISDDNLLKRAARNYLVATLVSIMVAAFYWLITPLSEAQSELLARTQPTLYDVMIALCGGAAGIVALSTRGNGNVIPGVAIATALMPPLCTAGYGLATAQWSYFAGAFYLYFINSVFICLATMMGVRMLRFTRRKYLNDKRTRRFHHFIVAIVVASMIPAAILTLDIVHRSVRQRAMRRFVNSELSQQGTQLISKTLDMEEKTVQVVAVGLAISPSRLDSARNKMGAYGLGDYQLEVYQGTQGDSILAATLLTQSVQAATDRMQGLAARQLAVEQRLEEYTEAEETTQALGGEVAALFPQVGSISVARALTQPTDSSEASTGLTAVVALKPQTELTDDERGRLQSWLTQRCEADTLRLVVVVEEEVKEEQAAEGTTAL